MARSSKSHTRCRLLSKLMNIFVDVPGGSGFVEEVALSTARRSLVLYLVRCVVSLTTDVRFWFLVVVCVFFFDVYHVDS